MGGGGGGTGITFETLSYALFKKSLLVKPATTLGKPNFYKKKKKGANLEQNIKSYYKIL